MASKKASLVPVGIVTLSYLAVAGALSFSAGNWEFVLYVAVVFIVALLIVFIHHYASFSKGVLWSLSGWGVMHMLGGLLPIPEGWPVNGTKHVLYSLWIIPGVLKYDHIVHAFGFGIATWACWQCLRLATKGRMATPSLALFAAIAGMGMGAFNEVIEFMATLLMPETNVGGYDNTGWDLVANLVGSTVAAVAIVLYPRAFAQKATTSM